MFLPVTPSNISLVFFFSLHFFFLHLCKTGNNDEKKKEKKWQYSQQVRSLRQTHACTPSRLLFPLRDELRLLLWSV